jgi:hypothetical protein
MPTIWNNGVKECAFTVTCISIEIIVQILGMIFGKAKSIETLLKTTKYDLTEKACTIDGMKQTSIISDDSTRLSDRLHSESALKPDELRFNYHSID